MAAESINSNDPILYLNIPIPIMNCGKDRWPVIRIHSIESIKRAMIVGKSIRVQPFGCKQRTMDFHLVETDLPRRRVPICKTLCPFNITLRATE